MCGIEGCTKYVGGRHHQLFPGTRIVYHNNLVGNGYVHYGQIEITNYEEYLILLEQYNIDMNVMNLSMYIPVNKIEILRLGRLLVADDFNADLINNTCPFGEYPYLLSDCVCQEEGVKIGFNEERYILPNTIILICGHILCDPCYIFIKERDYKDRICIIC